MTYVAVFPVNLRVGQICKQLGGTIDDSELVHGMVFEKGAQKSAGGPTRVENAKVSCLPPHPVNEISLLRNVYITWLHQHSVKRISFFWTIRS